MVQRSLEIEADSELPLSQLGQALAKNFSQT